MITDNVSETSEAALSTEAFIKAHRDDLRAKALPAEIVLKQLREIEAQARSDRALYAQWLVAKGIATNRLGFRGEALGDLSEACDILQELNDGPRLADAKREVAVVHSWCGEGRDAGLALLRSLAESLAAQDWTEAAQALIQAGRLEQEMDRPRAAAPLFDRGLRISGAGLEKEERCRAEVNKLQALVAAELIKEAELYRETIEADVRSCSSRLSLLVAIERIRCFRARGLLEDARRLLEDTRALVPDSQSFEAIELAEAEGELALAERNFVLADEKLRQVIKRCDEDDLDGREVKARLLRAKALDGLGRTEEAEGTLAYALRLAVARGLIGHADAVRTQIAARGGSENISAQDPARRYVRRRPLGEGGQGRVFRAYDIERGGEVALKRIDLAMLYETAQRERVIVTARTELKAAQRIDHPGVARVIELFIEPGGDATLIEQLINGPTLRSRMESPIQTDYALQLIKLIACALDAIHKANIVHCDLKPENIVLAAPDHPVIVDFGIALLYAGQRSNRGTPAYMAPEQMLGGRIDARTDLYALGIIAHELLKIDPGTARKFWPADLRAARSMRAAGLDPRVARILRRLVLPTKWLRPDSAAEVSQIIGDTAASSCPG